MVKEEVPQTGPVPGMPEARRPLRWLPEQNDVIVAWGFHRYHGAVRSFTACSTLGHCQQRLVSSRRVYSMHRSWARPSLLAILLPVWFVSRHAMAGDKALWPVAYLAWERGRKRRERSADSGEAHVTHDTEIRRPAVESRASETKSIFTLLLFMIASWARHDARGSAQHGITI